MYPESVETVLEEYIAKEKEAKKEAEKELEKEKADVKLEKELQEKEKERQKKELAPRKEGLHLRCSTTASPRMKNA